MNECSVGGLGCIPARFTAAAVVAAPTAEHRASSPDSGESDARHADQALVQLAGEQGDAVEASVVAEPMAGHADLAA